MTDKMIRASCSFCTGTLPTICLRTTQRSTNVWTRMCRACILLALRGIEEPDEYPAVIEDRDIDLRLIRNAEDS